MISDSSVPKAYADTITEMDELAVKLLTLGRPGQLLAFALINVAVSSSGLNCYRVCTYTLDSLSMESTY